MLSIVSALFVLLGILIQTSDAKISGDFSCTVFNGSDYTYARNAVFCSDLASEYFCSTFYQAPVTSNGYPRAGSDVERPLACYTTDTATPAATVSDVRRAAVITCPKTCGFCCLVDAYSCDNAPNPRVNCDTVTLAMCLSPIWHPIVSKDCPATCGFCNFKGCS